MNADQALTRVVTHTRHLFLDFDGPICSIFAGRPAPGVAADLREVVARHGVGAGPDMTATDDPIQVLRLAAALGDDTLTHTVAAALRDAELLAAQTAEPTPDLDQVIRAALHSGRRLAVVSNNSAEAVTAYLSRQHLRSSFERVIGRYEGMDMRHLKPHNHLVSLAILAADANPSTTTFVGDTTSDIDAARTVPIASIGYANKPGKRQALADAGASALIATMAELADALSSTPIIG